MGIAMQDDDEPHAYGWVTCQLCGRRWVGVWPIGIEAPLECPGCHEFAGMPDNWGGIDAD